MTTELGESTPGEIIDCTIGKYVVGCFDLLGQSTKLSVFPEIPPPEAKEEIKRFHATVDETFEAVDNFRRAFQDAFDGLAEFMPSAGGPGALPASDLKTLRNLADCRLMLQPFSDTIAVAARLKHPEGPLTAWPVWAIVMMSAHVMLRALASGVPMRGGIDIGLSADWKDLGIYGHALDKANYLEKKVAQWPRIVVGKEAVDFIASMRVKQPQNVDERWNADFAKRASELVCRRGDGDWMIDFAGPDLSEQLRGIPRMWADRSGLVRKAHAFVREQLEIHLRNHEPKFAGRYAVLERYLQSRLSYWQS